LKIVSIENPVEILVDGVEQINVETEDEYRANVASLLRQNPDIVYIAEINNSTALDTINASNTGKVVFSSLHANSISDVIARLQDMTGLSADRLLLTMHSCVYQELVRNDAEDRVYPKNRCLYFTDALKNQLYGKSLGEIKVKLMEEEAKWF
jgi:type II secretory ATPase GspE/PulE/Tfp pilus assembly ATPase PilB-like protein